MSESITLVCHQNIKLSTPNCPPTTVCLVINIGRRESVLRKLKPITDPTRPIELVKQGTEEDGFTYDVYDFGNGNVVHARATTRFDDLKSRYQDPKDQNAINAFQKLVKQGETSLVFSFVGRMTPEWIGKLVYRFASWKYSAVTISEKTFETLY